MFRPGVIECVSSGRIRWRTPSRHSAALEMFTIDMDADRSDASTSVIRMNGGDIKK